MSTSEHNTFLAFTTSMRRFEWAQFHFRLASSSHTTRSHSLSLSHFIKSFLFSFLLNVFILFILIMFCFNLTESNITLHIFFDTSEIIFLNWRDEKTNHKKRTRSQPKPPFNVDPFSKSHNATPHRMEWKTATGYAPLRMPVDTDQMETASTTTRSNKSNTRSIDDMIRVWTRSPSVNHGNCRSALLEPT